MTNAHQQSFVHRYVLNFPDHAPRKSDPHYKDFEAYRRRTHARARCSYAVKTGIEDECHGLLELHHSHIEFALQNAIDLKVLERLYPGISNPNDVGAWVESALNLEWLCEWHHRGRGGKHSLTVADWEAELIVRGLVLHA